MATKLLILFLVLVVITLGTILYWQNRNSKISTSNSSIQLLTTPPEVVHLRMMNSELILEIRRLTNLLVTKDPATFQQVQMMNPEERQTSQNMTVFSQNLMSKKQEPVPLSSDAGYTWQDAFPEDQGFNPATPLNQR